MIVWLFSSSMFTWNKNFASVCSNRGEVSARFIVMKFLHIIVILFLHWCHLPCEMKSHHGVMRWNFIPGLKFPNTQCFAKILKHFRKSLRLGCLTGFWMRLCYVRAIYLFHWSISTKYLTVFSPNAGKYGPGKTPYLDTFCAV